VDANTQQVACRFPQLTASVVPLYDIRFEYQQTRANRKALETLHERTGLCR
jgi:hypothetical protein